MITLKLGNIYQMLLGYMADLAMYNVEWRVGPLFFSYCRNWLNMSCVLDPLYTP